MAGYRKSQPAEIQSTQLATNLTMPGHQAGEMMMSGTFKATNVNMRGEIDISASTLGSSDLAFTFHIGIITPPGSKISVDDVGQAAAPGVTDYRKWVFVGGVGAETTNGSMRISVPLLALTGGAVYTWEIKWGYLSGSKSLTVGHLTGRVAMDNNFGVGIRGAVTNFNDGTVTIYGVGATIYWQRAPGLWNQNGSTYDPQKYWMSTLFTTATAGGNPLGVDIAGFRALVGDLGDNKMYLLNMSTGAVVISSAALAADPYDVCYYVGDPTKAVVACSNGHLYTLAVTDPAVTVALDINVGVVGYTTCANQYTGTTTGVWHGEASGGNAVLRGFTTAGAAINGAGGLTLNTSGTADITCIKRVPADNTLLVGTNKGKIYHVSKDGTTKLGTMTHPTTGVPSISDIASSFDGHLVYAMGFNGASSGALAYFWLPLAAPNGPAYLLFDGPIPIFGANIWASTGICMDANEDVVIAGWLAGSTVGTLVQFPGGQGYCRPNLQLGCEHARVMFMEN